MGFFDKSKEFLEAAAKGNAEEVKRLLGRRVNVNQGDEQAWTPLHWAAQGGHTDVARLLLDAGADVEAKTREGNTPLFPAVFNGHIEMVRLLLGGEQTPQPRITQASLHCTWQPREAREFSGNTP
jgi:ankyrin repeat protein